MTEYERKGHWRTLPDGTRTWVSAHAAVRQSETTHGYDDDVLKRRLEEKLARGQNEKKRRRKARKSKKAIAKAKLEKTLELKRARTAFFKKISDRQKTNQEEK